MVGVGGGRWGLKKKSGGRDKREVRRCKVEGQKRGKEMESGVMSRRLRETLIAD